MASHFAIGEGRAVRKIYLILCMLKLIIKRKTIILPEKLVFFVLIMDEEIFLLREFFVLNVLACLLPLDASASFDIFGVYIGFHASIEEDTSFSIVANVDPNLLVGIFLVAYPKIEPLHMPSCVGVWPEEQVVL